MLSIKSFQWEFSFRVSTNLYFAHSFPLMPNSWFQILEAHFWRCECRQIRKGSTFFRSRVPTIKNGMIWAILDGFVLAGFGILAWRNLKILGTPISSWFYFNFLYFQMFAEGARKWVKVSSRDDLKTFFGCTSWVAFHPRSYRWPPIWSNFDRWLSILLWTAKVNPQFL